MSDTRQAIRDSLQKSGRSMEWLSLQLGKNPAYIQQYLERGSPRDLRLEQKILTAELLGMPLSELGVSDLQIKKNSQVAPSSGGFREDAIEYDPPHGSLLTKAENISYYRMASDVLSRHPLRIMTGDVIAFDMSSSAIENLKSEQVVIVRCFNIDPSILTAETMVREYVRPGLLMTNRERDNEIFALDDPGLPFEPHIRGVLRTVVRNAI